MPLYEPQSVPTDCIHEAILGVMLPFYLTAAGGDVDLARAAVRELIEACRCATAMELDLAARMLAYSAAASDNLRRSMSSELSDSKVLRYRASAVALGRAAEQCRKALETMQTQPPQTGKTAALENSPPMPAARPAPVVPPPPAAPPRNTPPAQPHAATPPDPAPPDPVRPQPAPQVPAYLAWKVDDEPACAIDIDAMQRNITAMLADLRAGTDHPGPQPAEPPIAQTRPQRSQTRHPAHATIA